MSNQVVMSGIISRLGETDNLSNGFDHPNGHTVSTGTLHFTRRIMFNFLANHLPSGRWLFSISLTDPSVQIYPVYDLQYVKVLKRSEEVSTLYSNRIRVCLSKCQQSDAQSIVFDWLDGRAHSTGFESTVILYFHTHTTTTCRIDNYREQSAATRRLSDV